MKVRSFEELIEYIDKYKNNSKKMSKIEENFSKYLSLCSQENIMIFIDKIKNISGMERILYYKSDFIYKKFGIETILRMTKGMDFKKRFQYIYEMYEGFRIKYYTPDEYIEDLIANGESEYVCKNIGQLIDFADIKSLIELGILKRLKQLNPDKFREMHSDIVCRMTGIRPPILDYNTSSGLIEIVNVIAQNENVDISDIEYVGRGAFSDVYKLGDKVIKFGKNRLTDKIPYHKRILKPLLRKRVLSKVVTDLYIEVSEYLPSDNSITDEDTYLIYKELRDAGIIWLDAKKENLGRLQKDNIVHFDENVYSKKETVGYIPETIQQEEPLHKGDLVILDTDFLFREQDFDEKLLNHTINKNFYKVCEERYQEEKFSQKHKEIICKSKNIEER